MKYDFSEVELRKLNLNLLLTFSAVLRTGSAQAAAERLGIGTPAVSMALGRLRDGLGVGLFERTARGLVPTPAALAFWERIAPALGEISEAAQASGVFDPASTTLTFSLALPDDLSPWLAPEILKSLATFAPQARLKLRQSDFKRNLERLDSGEVDLALGATPRDLKSRHCLKTIRDEGFLILFDPRMFRGAKRIDLGTYLQADHMLLSPSGDFEGGIDEKMRSLGLGPRRVTTSIEHFSLFPRLLFGRPILAAMPATGAVLYAAESELSVSPLPFDGGTFPLSWHWSYRSDADLAQQWFRGVVGKKLNELFAAVTASDRSGC